jgi:hypothetical protein
VPQQIHTDQGRNFESDLFQEVCTLLDMNKTRTARYRPQSDGLIERFNRTLKQMLKSWTETYGRNWDDHLPYITMAYRATIHASTNCTPNLLMFGHEIQLPIDIMFPNTVDVPQCPNEYVEWIKMALSEAHEYARKHLQKSASRQKRLYDKNAELRKIKIGDWVWVFYPPEANEKPGRGWQGPYLIVKKLGEVNYQVQKDPLGKVTTVHVDHIKAGENPEMESWLENKSDELDKAIQVSDEDFSRNSDD